jgi:very-short-patch-repair endonuclease
MNPHYNRKQVEVFRKNLRNNSTSAEAVFWLMIKNKKLDGRRFRRQFSVGNYILDFFCPQEKLAVELDGEVHFTMEGLEYDNKRDAFLKSQGITVMRFENYLVFENPEMIMSEIRKNFKENL